MLHKCENPNCNNQTRNRRFCSVRCSAITTNAETPRVKLHKRFCVVCGVEIDRPDGHKSRQTRCPAHEIKRIGGVGHKTKSALLTSDTQKYRKIRSHARIVARKNGLLKNCAICGYSNWVETCHVKPIQGFPDSASVLDINAPPNLIGLCPNHHWEFDHGLISEEIIKSSQLAVH